MEICRTCINKKRIDRSNKRENMTAKEILRQHLHGYSNEQFEEAIKHFPLNECLIAMDRYKNQDLKIKKNENTNSLRRKPNGGHSV